MLGATSIAAATSGCLDSLVGSDVQDTDGDGVIDSEDYAPRDESVQAKSDLEGYRCSTSTDENGSSGAGTARSPTSAGETGLPAVTSDAAAVYDFEGTGDRLVDRTGNGHDGRLGSATRRAGRSGTVLDVDRGAHATVASADTLVPGDGGYTTAVWFRTDTVPADNYNGRQGLVIKRPGSSAIRWHFILHEDTVQLDARGTDDGGRVRSAGGYVDGNWHHAAAVWDGTQMRLYVDGQERATDDVSAGTIDPDSPLYLGAQPEYPRPLYFEGQLDDLVVYPRAISAEAVSRLYDTQQP